MAITTKTLKFKNVAAFRGGKSRVSLDSAVMNSRFYFLVAWYAALAVSALPASAQSHEAVSPWKLPMAINDENTKVRFEVDSTWHLVHGTTSGITGLVEHIGTSDPLALQVKLSLPVARFDTDNSSRDSKMRTVMGSEQWPHVTVEADRVSAGCEFEKVLLQGRCNAALFGKITIHGVSKALQIPFALERAGNLYHVIGSVVIRWADFGVEDPSIFIAKLDPEVTIHYAIDIPART